MMPDWILVGFLVVMLLLALALTVTAFCFMLETVTDIIYKMKSKVWRFRG